MSRVRAPAGEGQRLRAEILEATRDLLVESGDERAVTMRRVADRVGCSAPALYLHFSDRTQLVFVVCRLLFADLERFVEEAVRDVTDPLTELRQRGRAYTEFGVEHPEAYRVLFMGHADAVPQDFDVEDLLATGGFEGVVDCVRRCQARGQIVEDDPFEVAVCLWAAVHGITSLLISKPWFPWPDREKLVSRLLDIQIEGLTPT